MKSEQLEIARLEREFTKPKAERGIQTKARPLREGIDVRSPFVAKGKGLAGGIVGNPRRGRSTISYLGPVEFSEQKR